jgi:hypothetical protein
MKNRTDLDDSREKCRPWQLKVERLGAPWCEFLHDSPKWPIHGRLSVRPLWSTTPCPMGLNVGSPNHFKNRFAARLWKTIISPIHRHRHGSRHQAAIRPGWRISDPNRPAKIAEATPYVCRPGLWRAHAASLIRIGKSGIYGTRKGTWLESVPPGLGTDDAGARVWRVAGRQWQDNVPSEPRVKACASVRVDNQVRQPGRLFQSGQRAGRSPRTLARGAA